MSFASNLKRIMEEKGMSQTDLHAATGIGKSSISQYLKGINTPRSKVVTVIAEALECSPESLTGEPPLKEGYKNVPIATAARRIGKSEQFIRVGLQQGRLPFGTAVKMSSVYSYHISAKLLDEYIGVNHNQNNNDNK